METPLTKIPYIYTVLRGVLSLELDKCDDVLKLFELLLFLNCDSTIQVRSQLINCNYLFSCSASAYLMFLLLLLF